MNQEIIITSLFWLMLAGNTLWDVAYYRERDKRIAQEKKFISAMTSKEPALEKSESQIYGEAMEELAMNNGWAIAGKPNKVGLQYHLETIHQEGNSPTNRLDSTPQN